MTNLDMLLLKGASSGISEENLAELRYTILTKGIPANSEGMVSSPNKHVFCNSSTLRIATALPLLKIILRNADNHSQSELRIYIWLILLNAPPLRTDVYLDLVRQGASPAHAKIQNDTFRTFQGDPLFRRRVTQNSITRVLNAVAWRLNDAHEARVNGWQSPPTLSEFGGSPDTSIMSRHSFSTVREGTTNHSTTNDAEQIGYVQGMNVL